MSDDLKLRFEIVSSDNGTAATLRAITDSLAALDKQARKTGETLRKAFGAEALGNVSKLKTEAKSFGSEMSEAAEKAAKALRGDVAAVTELRSALRAAVSEQRDFAASARVAQTAGMASARSQASATRSAASARARGTRDTIADVGRTWRIRQASEASEMRHIKAVGKEHASQRREAMRSAREAGRHGYHAARSLNHPVHESLGFALSAGAAAGVGMAEHILRASEAFDTSMTRMRMFAPSLNADEIRKQVLGDSIALGVDASQLVDAITKSVRDGVPPEIARTLPKSVVAAAQVMGGDVEKLSDSLAEGLQEAFAMKWLKTPEDARKFLNIEAGLSTFAGNTAAKSEQFIASGGLGHGKEMGLDLTNTMAYGAMLNASGARTGQASARFMGQLSQNTPKMYDKYRQAVGSRKNSEEDRAVRSAPSKLGYGSIAEMQKRIMAGPDGLIDFAVRLEKLDDKQRKLTLEGYGFSEQGGAMLAELGANGGAKGKAVLARAKELASQKEANDYLSEKFAEWQKSISNMLKQIEAGWRAIENEIGDVIKSDIVAPFRDWWVLLSEQITHSNLKADMHAAIMGFVHGLGFEDVRHMLDGVTKNAKGFDFAGFATGVGEGIRAVVDSFRSMAGVFGGAGGISAETIGRVAAEMLGLSLALKAVSPVLSVMTAIVETFRTLSAVLATARTLGFVLGVAGAGEGAGAMAALGAGAAATGVGLAAMLGVAVVGGALAVAVMNWDAIRDFLQGKPKETPEEAAARPVRRLEDQSWWQFLSGAPKESIPLESDNGRAADKRKGLYHRNSFEGGDGFSSLRRDISWSPSDSGDVIRDATVGTERGVGELRDAVDRLGAKLTLASLGGTGGMGGGDGGGSMGSANRTLGWAGAASGGRYSAGGGSTPAKGALAANQKEAYAAAIANGLSPTAARALVANMSGEGLAVPHDRHWDGKHYSGGIVQWDPQRSAAIQRQFGKLPWEMSVAEQTKAAIWEIQSNPRFAATASALKGNDSGAMISALVGNYERPANVPRAIMQRMGYLRGFDPNAPAGGNAGPVGDLHLATQVLGEQCVDLAKAAVGATGSVRDWRKGAGAADGTLRPGTPVATFLDRQGRESDRYAGGGTGTPGAHLDHAGIFEKYLTDATGKRIGMQIAEQYAGSHGAHLKNYMFGKGFGEGNASNYHAIMGSDGKPLGGSNNPLSVKVDPRSIGKGVSPADVAGQVRDRTRPRPSTDDAPAGNMTSADNSTTIHAPIHIHGITDPHAVARTVMAHLDSRNSRYTDDESVA